MYYLSVHLNVCCVRCVGGVIDTAPQDYEDEDQREASGVVCERHVSDGQAGLPAEARRGEPGVPATLVRPQGQPAVLLREEVGPRPDRCHHPGGVHRRGGAEPGRVRLRARLPGLRLAHLPAGGGEPGGDGGLDARGDVRRLRVHEADGRRTAAPLGRAEQQRVGRGRRRNAGGRVARLARTRRLRGGQRVAAGSTSEPVW